MKKIGTKVLLSIVGVVLIAIVLLSIVSLYSLRESNIARITQVEEILRNNYDFAIKSEVEIIHSQVDAIYQRYQAGELSDRQAREQAASVIRDGRYGTEGYFFADTLTGDNVAMLGREDIEGNNRWDLTDKLGNKIIQNFAAEVKTDGDGYSNYYFPKAGQEEALPKRAYIKLFEPYGWMIGTGNYIDDIDVFVANERMLIEQQYRNTIFLILGLAFISLIIAVLLSLYISRRISKPIIKLTETINHTASLDITMNDKDDTPMAFKNELGTISLSIVNLRKVLRDVVMSIKEDSSQLIEASGELQDVANQTHESVTGVNLTVEEFAKGATEQATDAQDASSKMHDLSESIEYSVVKSNELYDESQNVIKKNDDGIKLVQTLGTSFTETINANSRLNENVDNLSNKSNSIGEITDTIEAIAEQTNLLALNAAIEAARAGDAGRGFAVVADEIRKLAEQTSESTSEITAIIQEIQSEINVTIDNMKKANSSIHQSSEVVDNVEVAFGDIESSMNIMLDRLSEIKESITNINDSRSVVVSSITGISAITEENAASAEEISATMNTQAELSNVIIENVERLKNITDEFEEMMLKFKV